VKICIKQPYLESLNDSYVDKISRFTESLLVNFSFERTKSALCVDILSWTFIYIYKFVSEYPWCSVFFVLLCLVLPVLNHVVDING
jgi:hypothetical protein